MTGIKGNESSVIFENFCPKDKKKNKKEECRG